MRRKKLGQILVEAGLISEDQLVQALEEQKKNKSLQNRLSKIESQIQQLEKDIQSDDKALAANYEKHAGDASFFAAYEKKKKDLDQLLEDWENVQMELETL